MGHLGDSLSGPIWRDWVRERISGNLRTMGRGSRSIRLPAAALFSRKLFPEEVPYFPCRPLRLLRYFISHEEI